MSTMCRWELLPEPRHHIARHMPDGPTCKKCSCHLQTHTGPPRARGGGAPTHQTAHDKWQEDDSPSRDWKPHKRQHPPNEQKKNDKQLSVTTSLPPGKAKPRQNNIRTTRWKNKTKKTLKVAELVFEPTPHQKKSKTVAKL